VLFFDAWESLHEQILSMHAFVLSMYFACLVPWIAVGVIEWLLRVYMNRYCLCMLVVRIGFIL
jgi:hypothetical protein